MNVIEQHINIIDPKWCNVNSTYPGYRSLDEIGHSECSIDIYGNFIDSLFGRFETFDHRYDLKHNVIYLQNGTKIYRAYTNKFLVAVAWYDENIALWQDSPFVENIKIYRTIRSLSCNDYRISHEGITMVTRFGIAYHIPSLSVIGNRRKSEKSRTRLEFNGKSYDLYRLVALCFVPIPEKFQTRDIDYLDVGFKDGNRNNYNANNLYWRDRSESFVSRCNTESSLADKEIDEICQNTKSLSFLGYENLRIDITGELFNVEQRRWIPHTNRMVLTKCMDAKVFGRLQTIILAWGDDIIRDKISDTNPYMKELLVACEFNELSKEDYKEITSKEVPWISSSYKYVITRKGDVWNATLRRKINPTSNVKYLRVPLPVNGKSSNRRMELVHRLVALCWIKKPKHLEHISFSKLQVNHLDRNTHNNCIENLEWCTASENSQHAVNTRHLLFNSKY